MDLVAGILCVGDVLSFGDPTGGRPLKRWRVVDILEPFEVLLQPLLDNGAVDEWTDACGDFRIRVHLRAPRSAVVH